MFVFAGIVPHPPTLIPEIGKGEETKIIKTRDAIINLKKLDKYSPELQDNCG